MPITPDAPAELRSVARARAPLRGRIRVPGSKSLSTRALVLAAIAPSPLLLRDLLFAEDDERLALAMHAMGVTVTRLFGNDRFVDGRALRRSSESVRVDLGDGGAPSRFAMALATLRAGETLIDGSARLRERPIDDGVRLLRPLGAELEYAEAPGRLPVRVRGMRAVGGAATAGAPERREPPVVEVGRTASSQFVSALLLIAPALPSGVTLRFTDPPTSASYLALTVQSLREFGAVVEGSIAAGGEIVVRSPLHPPREISIPGDASSAVVWVAAASLVPGSRIELEGVRRDPQPDVGAIEAIGRMGARLEWSDGSLVAEHAPLRGIDIDAEAWPDGALAVAAAATAASGTTRLRSLGTLRVKESDRLASLSGALSRLGASVRVEGDDLVIEGEPDSPAPRARPVEIDSHRDHRIAMSAAIVALRRGEAQIRDPGCVAKSYPGFWRDLDSLTGAGGSH